MFLEALVQVQVRDRGAQYRDEHALKIWLQEGFAERSCYRLSDFSWNGTDQLQALVAIKVGGLSAERQAFIKAHAQNPAELRRFLTALFVGKGALSVLQDPVLRSD